MWIVGLVVGLFVGGAMHGFNGAMLGALVGWAIGYGLTQALRNQDRAAKESQWDRRLDKLEARLQAIETQMARPTDARTASTPAPVELSGPAEVQELTQAPDAGVIETLPSGMPAPWSAPPPRPAEPASASRPQPDTVGPSAPQPQTVARTARAAQPSWLWSWLVGGNTVVRVGVVVLFFGVAFLLKYAYEHTHIPISVRLTGVAFGAMVLLVIGWRQRVARRGYALALQGGGVGVLYLTVFAALRLYQLIPPEAALVLLFFVAALSAALAVMQDAQSLAALGASGGFLAPILASTGSGNHVMLFSYYTMLNLGILGIAWYRAWRPLNVLGFAFTFSIGTLWGARFYQPELFASTEPFLIIFFLLYLTIPILFARQRARPVMELNPQQVRSYVDATLVFGTPLVAFGLQCRLVHDFEYGAAWSALALSGVYLVLARRLYTRHREEQRLLVEAFLALGVVFGTLAIPLALDGRWTSAAWALEGAAIVWAGVRQQRWLARAFGMLLQFAAGVSFLLAIERGHGSVPVLNSFYLGCVFISVAGLFSNWYLERNRERLRAWEPGAAVALFAWALAWWTAGALHEIDRWVSTGYQGHAALLFFAASCVALSLLSRALGWKLARFPAVALLLPMALVAALDAVDQQHPLAHLGWAAWTIAFAMHLWLLRRHEEQEHGYFRFLHAGQLWLLAALASWELAWTIDQFVAASPVWGAIAWAVVPGILLGTLATRAARLPWPVRRNLTAYLLLGAAPLALYLWSWVMLINVQSDGNASPLPYVPLLNPLDLAQFAALLAVVTWLRCLNGLGFGDYFSDNPGLVYSALGAAAFIALNGMLLRTLHHWAGVPFDLHAMAESMLVQAALSIFWTVLALCAMVLATRWRLRNLWMVGAALMGVVVVKLFLVDLSSSVERIVSFLGVGVLMLVIGYFSPVPPRISEGSK